MAKKATKAKAKEVETPKEEVTEEVTQTETPIVEETVTEEVQDETPKDENDLGELLENCEVIGTEQKPSGKTYLKVIQNGVHRYFLEKNVTVVGDKVYLK